MSVVTVELPNSLHKKLEELAEKEGISLRTCLKSSLCAAKRRPESSEDVKRLEQVRKDFPRWMRGRRSCAPSGREQFGDCYQTFHFPRYFLVTPSA